MEAITLQVGVNTSYSVSASYSVNFSTSKCSNGEQCNIKDI